MGTPTLNIFMQMRFKDYIAKRPKVDGWRATKEEVLDIWQRANPNMPIQIQPIPSIHKGPRYDVDGLRITGRAEFINSVLGRLKDLLRYNELPNTELDVEYKQVADATTDQFGMNKYAAYIYVLQKAPEKVKKPGISGRS